MKRLCKWKHEDHTTKVTGTVYYFDTVNGSNSNNGLSRNTPFLTQEYAESIMTNGDVLLPYSIGNDEFPYTSKANFSAYRLNDVIYHPSIVPSITVSRVSGTAPLAVFFDATGSTGLTNTNFFANNANYMDATFLWNFDVTNVDTGANYRTGSGFVAAHVFEDPGTYTVRCTVYDSTGRTAYKDTTITVSAFSGSTYYVASDGDDGNPGTIAEPFLTVNYALNGDHVQNNTRILFRNGDTFNTAYVSVTSSATGVIVGGYSDPDSPSAVRPTIYSTESDGAYAIMDLDTDDWRIMDIAARSGGYTDITPRYPGGIGWVAGTTNNLKFRTLETYLAQIPLNACGQYNVFAECEFHHVHAGGYSSTDGGINQCNAIIGNSIHDQLGPADHHSLRVQGGSKLYIAHNIFGPTIESVVGDVLTIRGDSDNIVVYDNTFYGFCQSFRPQNTSSYEEYVHHCVFDSNLLLGQTGVGMERWCALQIDAKDIVIRNNIIHNYQICITIETDTVVGPSNRIKFYNNTEINATASSAFYGVYVNTECLNLDIKNNLMYDTSTASGPCFLWVDEGTTFNGVSDNNMFYGANWSNPNLFLNSSLATWVSTTGNDTHSSIDNPDLVSADTSNEDFCVPQSDSPLVDSGEYTPAASDYYGNLRGSSRDIGACEYV